MYTRLSGGRQGWAVIRSPPFDPQLAKTKMKHTQIYTFTHGEVIQEKPTTIYLLSQLETSGVWTMKATVPQVARVDCFSLSHQPILWAQQLQQRTAMLRSCWFVTLRGNQNPPSIRRRKPPSVWDTLLRRVKCKSRGRHTNWCLQRCTLSFKKEISRAKLLLMLKSDRSSTWTGRAASLVQISSIWFDTCIRLVCVKMSSWIWFAIKWKFNLQQQPQTMLRCFNKYLIR